METPNFSSKLLLGEGDARMMNNLTGWEREVYDRN